MNCTNKGAASLVAWGSKDEVGGGPSGGREDGTEEGEVDWGEPGFRSAEENKHN